jgi:hypothetical protein
MGGFEVVDSEPGGSLQTLPSKRNLTTARPLGSRAPAKQEAERLEDEAEIARARAVPLGTIATQRVQSAKFDPCYGADITGWGLLGGWPLFTDNALKWPAGTIKCVSIDAMPQQLAYVRSGHVQLLLGQDVYGYGRLAVEMLIDKLLLKKTPTQAIANTELMAVNRANVEAVAKNWEKWLPK